MKRLSLGGLLLATALLLFAETAVAAPCPVDESATTATSQKEPELRVLPRGTADPPLGLRYAAAAGLVAALSIASSGLRLSRRRRSKPA